MKGKLQRIGQVLEAAEGKFVEIRGECNGMKVVHNSFIKEVNHHSPWLNSDGDMNYEYEAIFSIGPKKSDKVCGTYKKGNIYGRSHDTRVKKIWAITVIV